jgi:transglutaminase-like putative cysteine protease
MRIRAGFEIAFECQTPTPLLLMLNVRPERRRDLETPDSIVSDPDAPIRQYRDSFGNVCSRLTAPAGGVTLRSDFVIRDSGRPDELAPDAAQHAIEDLPDEVILYLLGSRYCETQHLSEFAWSLFGHTPAGWARVQAIVDYVHQRLKFSYADACPTRTAWQAHEEQLGVCRDFAHLAIAFCRCMNIPARYCTGYLGDIGVPASPDPMDFSAWFEVYLGGAWRTFDARHNRRRIGRILMAVGRDATDVAISTSFGPTQLARFEVFTDELPEHAPSHRAAAAARVQA